MLILDGIAFNSWLDGHASATAIRLEHLAVLLSSGALLLLWTALGAAARRALESLSHNGAEEGETRLVVELIIGAGLFALLMLLLSVVGALSPIPVLAVTAGAAIGLRRELRSVAARTDAALRTLPSSVRIVLAVALAILLVRALLPPADWDTLMYHLRLPIGALEQGRFNTPVDAQAFNALIGVAHLAVLPLVALGLYEGPAVVNVLMLPLLVAGTVSLARAIVPAASGRLAAGILLGSPALFLVAWTARIDSFFACAALAVHLATLDCVRRKTMGAVAVAALAAGTAIGVKSLAAAYIVALIPLALFPYRLSPRLLGAAVLLGFVASFPWLLKSWLIAGTPLYPIGYSGTLEPWLAQLAAERPPHLALDRSALQTLAMSRQPFNIWDAFFAPMRLTIEGEGRLYRLSPVLLLFPLGLLLRSEHRQRWLASALVPVLFLGFVVLPATEINLRYLLALYPVLAALTAAALSVFAAGVPRVRMFVLSAIAVVALWPSIGLFQDFLPIIRRDAAHVLGNESARANAAYTLSIRSLMAVSETIAERGSSRDTVLMLWEARALALRQPVVMDAFTANWPLLAQLPVSTRCLQGTGVKWVVLGAGGPTYYATRGTPPALFRVQAFEEFAGRCLHRPVYARDGFVVFQVRSP